MPDLCDVSEWSIEWEAVFHHDGGSGQAGLAILGEGSIAVLTEVDSRYDTIEQVNLFDAHPASVGAIPSLEPTQVPPFDGPSA